MVSVSDLKSSSGRFKCPYDGKQYFVTRVKVDYLQTSTPIQYLMFMKMVPRFPGFPGKFKTFSVALNTNRETGSEERLLVYSKGSRASTSEFLWLKWLWGTLSKAEYELFIALPETIKEDMKYDALRASITIPMRQIRKRLIQYPYHPLGKAPTYSRFLGLRKAIIVETNKYQRTLPKVPKFSGWIKSSSQLGSKRPRGSGLPEPIHTQEENDASIKFDWYFYLTVGN